MTNKDNRPSRPQPVEIKTLLADICRKKKWQQRLELHAIFQLWNGLVGEDIAAQAQPSLIRGLVLWVKVTDPIWMQQLHLQKPLLLEKINQQLTDIEFTDIRFQLDTAAGVSHESSPAAAEKTITPPAREELRKFEALISPLQNEEVKKSLRNLWISFNSTRS